MGEPFVGPPSGDLSGRCAYAPDIDQPVCESAATVHLRVEDAGWGMVALPSCDAHLAIAEGAATVLDRHPFGLACSAPMPMFLPTHCESGDEDDQPLLSVEGKDTKVVDHG